MPVDRGAIDAQLREIGEGERWWEQREFRELPHILRADERIQGIVNGKLLGSRGIRLKPTSRWLVVATSQRLVCLKQERFARKQVDIALDQITRIQQGSGFRAFRITIETPLQRYRIRIPNDDAFRFAGTLARLVPEPPSQRPDPGAGSSARIPGLAGIVAKLPRLSPPGPASQDRLERLEATVERLQHDVDRLQQQVAFLEDLLLKRNHEALFSPSSTEP